MDDFFSDIKREHRKRREYLPVLIPEEAERLQLEYPKGTPEAYRHISPAEFFDGKE